MNNLSTKPALWLRYQEFFLFCGVVCWFAASYMAEVKTTSWGDYFRFTWIIAAMQSPALLFAFFSERLRTTRQYWFLWALAFGILLPGLAWLGAYLEPGGVEDYIFITAAFFSFFVGLILVLNSSYRAAAPRWFRKIGFETAVLLIVCLISVVLAAMAASSIQDPAYDFGDRLLIGFEFSPIKIYRHFGYFLIYFFQLLLIYLCGYFLFYFNSRFLVAKVMKEQGLVMYILSAMAAIGLFYPILSQLLLFISKGPLMSGTFNQSPFATENAFAACCIIFLSMPILLSFQWSRQNGQIMELEKEKARAEVDLLKQQLNPHFFFNTLNNLYALSLQQSKQTPESILKLSELMRYVIYKGQQAEVSMEEEVKYVTDYIQLQQIRLRKPLDFRFEKNIGGANLKVPPMLLIVFVENAFKHGIEPAEDGARLNLKLHCDEQRLYFGCENSFEPEPGHTPGIGLANLRRRLALLFPGRHQIETLAEKNTFKAVLQIDFS